jgi:hypothetical protein
MEPFSQMTEVQNWAAEHSVEADIFLSACHLQDACDDEDVDILQASLAYPLVSNPYAQDADSSYEEGP